MTAKDWSSRIVRLHHQEELIHRSRATYIGIRLHISEDGAPESSLAFKCRRAYVPNRCPSLFKLKEDAEPTKVRQWQTMAQGMVGQVPGLLDLQAAPPLELTAPMAKGFDMGVVVVLDYLESLATFFTHPSHKEVNVLYEQVCDHTSTVGYDIEF
ncbi:Hypothetical predicted protein [Lecanosticta acicola]|uniref:Stress-response A/B barrel domain-containing protein n=1 Tax=Lecanosticta acicola TaxID=111012 RepID=A0AAI9EFL9_9PEZI|nr:Hypothetical predicted protein [Lecanosticta acicola]